MPTGKIKWVSQQMSAGFIRSDEGKNVFFGFSAIQSNGPRTVRRGQCVSFDIVKNLRSISPTAAIVKTSDTVAD